MVRRVIENCQELIYASIDEEDTCIGGSGIQVQIDESKFGKGNTTKDTQLKVFG